MSRKIFIILSLVCLLVIGCKRTDGPIPPQPPPIPSPQPIPKPEPDINIDPNSPEKIVSFNVTFEQMQKDIIGKWITLNNSQRWLFRQGDSISITKASNSSTITVISNIEVVVDARIVSTSPQSPGTQLSGFIKIRYEQVDGNWFMTEVIRVSIDNYNLSNR